MDWLTSIIPLDPLVWLIWAVQGAVVFLVSTFLFDAVHFLLHRWAKSPVPLLRMFSRWHHWHHAFLDKAMRIHPDVLWQNYWYHVVPEFLTTLAGTLLFLIVFDWQPVVFVALMQARVFIKNTLHKGYDSNHMEMERLEGQIGHFWVTQSYHALHHIFPNRFYSSYSNGFDLIFGTAEQFERRNFLVTGASGAFGSALVKRLEAMGAFVETAKYGVDYRAGDYSGLSEKLGRAEVLVLAHGAKSEDCYEANYTSFVGLIEAFRAAGKTRLVPPEVWALGSEAELHGDMGLPELRDYAGSKRAFAWKAREYYQAEDMIYRHIVPSAFTSQMGPGPISAETAVSIALFFITRGFRYVPVTVTSLAVWNYFRFRYLQKPPQLPVAAAAE